LIQLLIFFVDTQHINPQQTSFWFVAHHCRKVQRNKRLPCDFPGSILPGKSHWQKAHLSIQRLFFSVFAIDGRMQSCHNLYLDYDIIISISLLLYEMILLLEILTGDNKSKGRRCSFLYNMSPGDIVAIMEYN